MMDFLASGGRWSTTTHHEAQTIRIAESSHHHVQQKHLLSIGDKGCTLRMLVDGMALGERERLRLAMCAFEKKIALHVTVWSCFRRRLARTKIPAY